MKHIVFAIGSLYGGGAERVVSVWSSALVQKGYRVSVIVYSRSEDEYAIDQRVEVCPIATSGQECEAMSVLQRLTRFRTMLKGIKPSVVISFLPEMQVYIALAAIGLRIPRVETVRINPWKADILATKYAFLWRWCFWSSRAIIVQSEDQKAFFSQKVQKKAVVIPNPVNHCYIENPKMTYFADSHKIVAAGRLADQKNYHMMIDAIKIVSKNYPDVSLQIYGAGEKKALIQSYIEMLGLEGNITLMGRSSELYRIYQDADIYVMSSDFEGMPNALVEAMAMGLPCISTDCKTGPRDLIDDGENGYLVPCGDPQALAEAIKRMFSLSDSEQRNMGHKARAKILCFCSEENSLKRLMALIEGL